MIEFQLFRLQVIDKTIGRPQMSLFPTSFRNENGELNRSELLIDVFSKLIKSETEARKWRAGNVQYFQAEKFIYFRFGKIKISEKSKYRDGNFIEESDTDAPFTHLVFDISNQVVAIAKKTSIAPTVKGIANALAKFLNSFSVIQQNELTIEVEAIWNPEDFLASITDAYAVSKYWVRVKHPNAFDVNQDFILPMEKTLSNADGESIKAEIKGKDLKKESLEDYTRSCASKGNEAGATIQKSQRSKRKSMVLGRNPVTVDGDEEDNGFLKNLIKEIRDAYQKIRYGNK